MSLHKPAKVEFDLGPDRYKRRSLLIGERENGGPIVWSIVSQPMDQRDDGEHIRSLNSEQLLRAVEIVRENMR